MEKISLCCKCGDCGDWQIMYKPEPLSDDYTITYRCRNCGREYQSIEEILREMIEI